MIRGRSPLWLYSDLATCAANPQKALAQQGFPCIRCWPRHRRKHRMKKLEKVAFSHFFDSLASASSPEAEVPILYCSPDAFSPSRGRSLRIPPALHHNNKRPPQGRSFVIGGAGEIRTHGRLSTVTRFPVVPVMTTSILLHDQCGRAYVAALDYDTILFV